MSHFSPVAFTYILCKLMERVAAGELTTMVGQSLDPFQFAYKAKRGVEDASLTLLDTMAPQLTTHHMDFIHGLFTCF